MMVFVAGTSRFLLRALSFASITTMGFLETLHAQREDLQFEFISVEQGLSNALIVSIIQDSRGFLWVGTINGLNKYDGYSFTVFKNDPQDSTSLAASPITFLKEDQQGVLWVSTESGGLHRFNRNKNNFTRFVHDPTRSRSLSGNGVGPVYEDKDGTLFPTHFGMELQLERGWFAGNPEFDYVTTTAFPNGDVET